MSYRSLVDAQVRKAFNLLKDLAVDAVLNKKGAAAFDFGTGEATLTSDGNIPTKIIEVEAKKPSKKTNVTEKTVMMKSQDVGDLNLFDTITVDGVEWKLGSPIKNDGYILITTMFREG